MYKLILLGSILLTICLCTEAQEIKSSRWMSFRLTSDVSSVCVSSDGKLAASGTNSGVQIWSLERGKAIHTLPHAGTTAVSFSHDGKLLASGSSDKLVKIWSAEKGTLLNELKGHFSTVKCVCFSPDGKYLASAALSGTILWSLETYEELRNFESVGGSVCFSPDGQFLAIGIKDGIEVKSVPMGLTVKSFSGHTDTVNSVCFSRDGKLLASSGRDYKIKIWSLETDEELSTIMAGRTLIDSSLSFDPTGKFIGATDTNRIQIWSTLTGKVVNTTAQVGATLTDAIPLSCLCFSPDWKFMISGHTAYPNGVLKLWSLTYTSPDGNITAEDIKKSSNKTRTSFQLSSEGSLTDRSQMAEIFRQRFGTNINKIKASEKIASRGHTNIIEALAFSPDGRLLATGSHDQTVRVWSTTNGINLKTFQGHASKVNKVCFTPDAKFVISASEDTTIKIWNMETGNEEATLTHHRYPISCMALSPDGSLLASGRRDVAIYDMRKGEVINTLSASGSDLIAISFSSGGGLLASIDAGGSIYIWNMPEGTQKINFKPGSSLYSLDFSHDEKFLVVGCLETPLPERIDPKTHTVTRKGVLKIWSVESGDCVKTIDIPHYSAKYVEFSPDDSLLLFISDDIFVASAKTGEKVLLIKQDHANYNTIYNICVSPDWRYIAGGGYKQIKVWELRGESGGREVSGSGKESDLNSPSEPVRRGVPNEAEAKSLLSMAKNFKLNKLNKLAIEKLNELLKKYPDSEYADEARELLKDLKK